VAALTKFELSYAYPFMSLAFVLVLLSSALLFHETVTMPQNVWHLADHDGDHYCRPRVRFGLNIH
jgi:hypothetical protein